MDPLSIAASSVALIQTANFITTSLIQLGKGIRDADSRLSALCDELSDLTGLIDAVDRMIKKCRPIQSDLVDDELWEQCDVVVGDCHGTLNELRCLIERIESPSKSKRRRFSLFHRRVRVALDLSVYGRDLVGFREKIHKSNWALQTMLQTVIVCICHDQASSQNSILFEVGKLGTIIDEALRASHKRQGPFVYNQDQGDAKIAGNLRKLLEAATNVRSAASSRASSKADSVMNSSHQGKARNRSSNVRLMVPGSIGDMTEDQRYRVEAYVETMREAASRATESSKIPPEQPVSTHSIPPGAPMATTESAKSLQTVLEDKDMPQVDEDQEEDDDDDFDGPEYCDGLRDMARECIVKQDFVKAICFLTDALQRKSSGNAVEACTDIREIQHQLVLCHLFRNDWRKAAPIVQSLAKGKGVLDEATCNLLHALSLAQLRDPQYSVSLDTAMKTCRLALRAKQKLFKQAECHSGADGYITSDYYQTLGLFATIHRMRNDLIRYSMYHKRLPTTFIYIHPANEAEYIMKHPRLLSTVLGEDAEEFWMGSGAAPSLCGETSELDAATNGSRITRRPTTRLHRAKTSATSPLRTNLAAFLRYDVDSEKQVVCGPIPCPIREITQEIQEVLIEPDASQEASPKTPIVLPSPQNALRRGLTRVFTTRRVQQRKCSSMTVESRPVVPSTTASSQSSGSSANVKWRPIRRQTNKAKELIRENLPIVGLTLVFPISIPVLLWRRRKHLQKDGNVSVYLPTEEHSQRIMSWLKAQTQPGAVEAESITTTDEVEAFQCPSSPLPNMALRYTQQPAITSYYDQQYQRQPHELDRNEILELQAINPAVELSDAPMTPSDIVHRRFNGSYRQYGSSLVYGTPIDIANTCSERALTVSDLTSIPAPSTLSQPDRLHGHYVPQAPELLAPFGCDMSASLERPTRPGEGEVQKHVVQFNVQPRAPDTVSVDTNDYTRRLPIPVPTPAFLQLASPPPHGLATSRHMPEVGGHSYGYAPSSTQPECADNAASDSFELGAGCIAGGGRHADPPHRQLSGPYGLDDRQVPMNIGTCKSTRRSDWGKDDNNEALRASQARASELTDTSSQCGSLRPALNLKFQLHKNPKAVDELTNRVAGALAALYCATEQDRLAVRAELNTLLTTLEQFGMVQRDPFLGHDIRRVLVSLDADQWHVAKLEEAVPSLWESYELSPVFNCGWRQPSLASSPADSISGFFELHGDYPSLPSDQDVFHDAHESAGRALGRGASTVGMPPQLFPLLSSSVHARPYVKSSLFNSGFNASEESAWMSQFKIGLLDEVEELVRPKVSTSVRLKDTVLFMRVEDSSEGPVCPGGRSKKTMDKLAAGAIPEQRRKPSSPTKRIAVNSQCGSKPHSVVEDNMARSDTEEMSKLRPGRLSPILESPILEWQTPMSAERCKSPAPRTPFSFIEGDDHQFTCPQKTLALASEQLQHDHKEAQMCQATLPTHEAQALGENLARLLP